MTDYAAEVAPVVHGEWVAIREDELSGGKPEFACYKPIGGYFCSRCRCEAVYSYNGKYVLSSFCPNCGAKMDIQQRNKRNTKKMDGG